MSEIKIVSVSSIDPNALRQLKDYPFNEKKIETLMRSIADVGLWEGVIARKEGSRYQLAFGHHRIEAAKRQLGKDARISVIVRDLTDEQMIQFMGRENLEDYNADFLIMMESWEAAEQFLTESDPSQKPEAVQIARLLGWVMSQGGNRKEQHRINDTAMAASSASRLIKGGYIKKDSLSGLTTHAVREICGRVVAHHEMLEKMAKTTNRPAPEITAAKKVSGKAGERAARDIKAGRVAHRDIRGAVDTHAYRHAREARKQTPLFAMFGSSLIEQIRRCALDDSIGEKLREIKKALTQITAPDDVQVVKRLALECENASERFINWHKTLANPKTKVVSLKSLPAS